MKTQPLPLLSLLAVLLFACSPRIRTIIDEKNSPANAAPAEIIVFDVKDRLPEKSLTVGTIEINGRLFTTDCDWKTILQKAKTETLKAGGNALQVVVHTEPREAGKTCHELTANILYLDPATYLAVTMERQRQDSAIALARLQEALKAAAATKAAPQHREKFTIGLLFGTSRLTAPVGPATPDFLRTYLNRLNTGTHFNVNGAWFFNKHLGIGIKYSNFKTSGSFGSVTVTEMPSGKSRSGPLSDNITIQHIAPSIDARLFRRQDLFVVTGSIGLGYVRYKNEAWLIDSYTVTGESLALTGEVEIDFKVTKNFALATGASFMAANVNNTSISESNINTPLLQSPYRSDDISRIDLHFGMRVFW